MSREASRSLRLVRIAALLGGAALLGLLGCVVLRQGFEGTEPVLVREASRLGPERFVFAAGLLAFGGGTLLRGLGALLARREDSGALVLEELDEVGLKRVIDEVRSRVLRELRLGAEASVLLDELLRGALLVRASDLHLSPLGDGAGVTYRIDGTLHEVVSLPAASSARIAQRLKVLARIDPYAKDARDGKLARRIQGLAFEARVNVLPAEHGDRVVLRFSPTLETQPSLGSIGLGRAVTAPLEGILARGQGILFVSGPVGSGKTTTLYAALAHIHQTRGSTTSLVTLEDPIERRLPFATQSPIDARHGRGFAQTLRSVLRQDPNVLMIGEIRDEETAKIATQAGLSGHLILTTIHVESAAGTFARLFDMGVEPFIVTSATAGCLSQRLVRVLCGECRRGHVPSAEERAALERLGLPASGVFFEAAGCPSCEGQGYVGRMPVAELLVLSPRIRQAIVERRSTQELAALAVEEGMVPLSRAAFDKAAQGITSLGDALRAAS